VYAFSIKNQYMHDLSVDGFAERSVRGSETEGMRMMRMQRRGKAGLGAVAAAFTCIGGQPWQCCVLLSACTNRPY